MLSDWSIARRIAISAVVALSVGVLVATLAGGLSPSYPVKVMQLIATTLAAIIVIGVVMNFVTSRLADYTDPADEEEFERLVQRSEQLARDNLAADPDEDEFMALDPRNPHDFRSSCARRSTTCRTCCCARSTTSRSSSPTRAGATAPTGSTWATPSRATTTRTGSSSSATRCCATSATIRTSCARRSRAPCATSWRTISAPTSWASASWGCERAVMIVMTPEAGEAEIEAVKAKLKTTGVHVLVLPGELTTAIGAIGDPEGVRELGLEGMAGVDRVVPISRPYKLASSELAHHEPTEFAVDGRRVGGNETFCLIAGPCTVESREQTLGVARTVRDGGASMLRGGAFKPRTSPFAFKGLGVEALEILAAARAETGLPIVTEFLDTQHADAIAAHADVVQIGARNMQNYALLEVAGKLGKPVLLKRGLSSSLDELLMAADYVLKEGNERVMLCERGIRTFETATRFTLDLSAVPWLKLHSHLPVIVDPSHASGDRRLVEPLSRAAAAVGADGIIVEVHQDPEAALCDGPQALYASDFPAYAEHLAAHAALVGRTIA